MVCAPFRPRRVVCTLLKSISRPSGQASYPMFAKNLTLGMMISMAVTLTVPAGEPRPLSRLVETFAAGKPAAGIFSGARDFPIARAVGAADLDYLIIDMEHGPFDVGWLRQHLVNLRRPDGRFGVTPIVRIPANGGEVHANQWMFKQVLDAGAFGVMVPFVNNAEEARQAVIAMRYPAAKDNPAKEPRGVRGWASTIPAIGTWGITSTEYLRKADLWPLNPRGELILAVQIETVEAIGNLREILAVPGVGAAFIGPADLHADMGYLGQIGVPEVEEQIQKALAIAREMKIPIGLTTGPNDARERVDQGFGFITVPGDAALGAGLVETLRSIGRE